MRYSSSLALGLAVSLLLSASAALAADGIKATATATREVAADIMVLTIQIAQRITPDEGGEDQQAILTKALESNGLKVLERRTRYMIATSAYGTRSFNIISSAGNARDAVEVQKTLTYRVTGYKRLDDVIGLLGRHGVREKLTIAVDHSNAAAARRELEKEAIAAAIEQAKAWAGLAGVRTGGVIDLVVQSTAGANIGTTTILGSSGGNLLWPAGTDQTLSDPERPGELPRLKLSVSATVVLAAAPN